MTRTDAVGPMRRAMIEAVGTRPGAHERGLGPSLGASLLALGVLAVAWAAVPAPARAADVLTSRNAEAALPLAHPRPPKLPAHRSAEPVFSAVALGQWKQVYALAARNGNPLLSKVVDWIRFSTLGEPATFEEIAVFIDQNPDWPEMRTMRQNAEGNLDASIPNSRIIDWLSRHPPLTPVGATWLATAYQATGEHALAERTVRHAWIGMNFSGREERRFYSRFRKMLTAEDHARRLDRLLWVGRSWEARRMLRRVGPDERIVAVARLRLRRFRGGVDWAIRRMPPDRMNDLGFLYERLRWRRKKGRDQEAIALLDGLPKTLPRPELWWRERGTLARRALRRGDISVAYRLAHSHRQTGGEHFADAEWLAGWIALRFLKDPKTAATHFQRMWSKVSYPVSRARAAYWAGRAAEASGNRALARDWYVKAGRYFTVFYGQLALGRLETKVNRPLPRGPKVVDQAASAYLAREVVRAAKLIAGSPDPNHLKAFIRHLSRTARNPAEAALAAGIAEAAQRPSVALRSAKRALRNHVVLINAGWPREPLPDDRRGIEAALLLGLMRQESAFDREALSWAGARGLMQLMPETARRMARRLNLPFSRKRLLDDPHYNLTIGTAYLAKVLSDFSGSYVLALAAYNAGPSRARRWLQQHGDFRRGEVDVVDWIEMIPFDETRDYVQRVIENLHVYRALLGGGGIAETAITKAAL